MIEITDKVQCCGCEACVQACPKQCIAFDEDEYGFRYPHINLNECVKCGLCEKVCPVINAGVTERWPQRVVASKNKNEEQRRLSSSGGLFILLAEETIKKGGVVFGARFDSDWNVVHSCDDTFQGIMPFMGSKYVQSRIGESYKKAKEYLDEGRYVLFSGTSCQIAGLKNYLKDNYDKLLTVESMCHGVPSPRVWREYLDFIRCSKESGSRGNTVLTSFIKTPSIEGISFRDKQNGWGKYGIVVRFSSDKREKKNNGLSSENDNQEDYEIRDALVKRLDFFDQEFLKKKEEEINKRVEEAKAKEGKVAVQSEIQLSYRIRPPPNGSPPHRF